MDLATYLRSVLNRNNPLTIDLTSARPRQLAQSHVVIDLTQPQDAEMLEPSIEEQIEIFLRLVELENSTRGFQQSRKGLPKKKINSLGCWRVRRSRQHPGVLVICENDVAMPESCAICLETFHASTIVRLLPCKHIFHKACIDKWLSQNDSCPLDRSILN